MLRNSILSLAAASLLTSGIAFAAEAGDGGGAPAAAAPVTETKTVIKQNGIKRPDAGSVTGKLWDIADALSEQLGKPAPRADVVKQYLTDVPNANQATANTQYARWVTFHGVSGILREQRAAETKARRDEAEAKKAAEKEAAAEAKKAELAAAEAAKTEKAQKAEEAKAAKEAEKTRKAEEKAAAKAEKDRLAAEAKATKDAEAAAAKAAAENKPAA